ncbi:PQQ-binding-like beta-propeller repeat protein [Phycisphaerales bacterium AB-hyl4]|uniref:PQQ-binding-like beta-propeller repeat protein n=1 Tax=Natronomicrosphaera hydrolytica TaxID=3242702 RepID=A0ABV4U4N0_9BACT
MGTLSRTCLVLVLIWGWGGGLAAGQANRPTVYIEDSPAAQELFDEARSFRRQDRLADAAERLQRVIDEYPHKLMRIDEAGEDVYEDALLQVHRALLNDRSLREAYRSRYSGRAQRRLDEALEPWPDGEAMERVARRYTMTRPGLEAGLLLSGWYLERADGRSAASVLDTLEHHPDLGDHRERYDYLQAVAGLLGRDRDRLHRHRDILIEDGEDDAVSQLDALAHRLHPPLRLEQPDHVMVDVGDLPELLRRPLWETEVDFTASPSEARGDRRPPGVQPGRRSGRGGGRGEDHHPPVMPTAGENHLYINEGRQVRALDRNSGWTTWEFKWEPDQMQEAGFPQFGRMASGGAESQPVVLHGQYAFAVMGHSSFWPARWQGDTSPTALVALDRDTGEKRWLIEPAELDEVFERSNFQGTLIAGEDTLFSLVRRSQASGFQDTFLVAINQRDGSLRWRRHLSSAATTSRYATGPRPEMSAYGSTIYVSDNIGTVAAIDTRHGTLRWARVFTPDRSMIERGVLRGEIGTSDRVLGKPIRMAGGLIVPSPAMEGRKIFVFDPDTGEVRQELSDPTWARANHLLPIAGDVLAIGRDVVLFDGETLEAKWRHRLEGDRQAEITGRAAISERHVLIPTNDQILMLRREDGEVARRIETDEPGNVLVFDGQLVIAAHESVRSYLDWRRAANHLRQQVRDRPEDAGAGLALAHLALRANQSSVVLEGVDAALDALQRPALRQRPSEHRRQQADVFDKLLDLVRLTGDSELSLRGDLFDRMATTTAGPKQDVAYHLAVAEHHVAKEQPRQAAEHLQAVLLDETLSSQLYEQPQVARQAGLEARRRLVALVEREGRDVYATFDAQAERQLDRMLARDESAEALARLARQYPLARSAPRALREAGRLYAADDAFGMAAQQFRRAFDHAMEEAPQLLPEIVGELAELFVQRDRPRQAAAWLERVRQLQPDLEPMRDGEPTSLTQWISELSSLEGMAGDRPKLALPLQQPRVLAGKPLVPASSGADEHATDRLLTLDSGVLRLHVGPTLESAWERDVSDEPMTALSVTTEQVLLWLEDSRKVVALDSKSGDTLWQPVEVDQMLSEAGDPRERDAARPREQREFIEMIEVGPIRQGPGGRVEVGRHLGNNGEGMTPLVGTQTLVLADGQGRVVGLDRATGQVQWARLVPIDELTAVDANHDSVVLAGVSGMGTDAVVGTLIVLDMLTGEPHFPAVEDNDPPQWVGFTADNLVAVATSNQVAAYQLGTGDAAWRLTLGERSTPLTDRGWSDEHLLLLLDNAGMALTIEAASGQLLNRLSLADGVGASRIHADAVEPNWHLSTPTSMLAITEQGRVAWRDAVSLSRKQFVHQLNSRDHAIILHREMPDNGEMARNFDNRLMIRIRPGDGDAIDIDREPHGLNDHDVDVDTRYRLFILERTTGRLIDDRPLGPLPARLESGPAMLLDNHLVFDLHDRTLIIPGASDASSNRDE